jgi:hypothetical protein
LLADRKGGAGQLICPVAAGSNCPWKVWRGLAIVKPNSLNRREDPTMRAAAEADYEASLLGRILTNDQDELPRHVARYLARIGFSRVDKERMHDLAVRNQASALSDEEKVELFAYARVGTVLAFLKSKARRALKSKPRSATA